MCFTYNTTLFLSFPLGQVRLAQGAYMDEGRAEMFNRSSNTWGTICDDNFVSHGWPSVICRQLGYNLVRFNTTSTR